MLRRAGVATVTNHQCMFGLMTPGPDGTPTPAKKPTKWMSNSKYMLDALVGRCDGTQPHQHLMGGRAAAAAFYPAPLLRAMIKGMADTKNNLEGVKMIADNERNVLDALNTFVAAIPRETTDDNTTAPTASGGNDSRTLRGAPPPYLCRMAALSQYNTKKRTSRRSTRTNIVASATLAPSARRHGGGTRVFQRPRMGRNRERHCGQNR